MRYVTYRLSDSLRQTSRIEDSVFSEVGISSGLRSESGVGTLVGVTRVSEVVGYRLSRAGELSSAEGYLGYRGYSVVDIAHGNWLDGRYGFEETCYLLLSGSLPDADELYGFCNLLYECMSLSHELVKGIINTCGGNLTNIISRCVLGLAAYDSAINDFTREHTMQQSVEMLSHISPIIAYASNLLRHSDKSSSLHLRHPHPDLSYAENFLYMLKRDYTNLEARTLDLLLTLDAEDGGGSPSTYAVRVSSSARSDIYSAIATGIGVLGGQLSGGVALAAARQFEYLKEHIFDWRDLDEIDAHLERIICGDAFDRSGCIYGIGHDEYTMSDPRVCILSELLEGLAMEKRRSEEFYFLERLASRATVLSMRHYAEMYPDRPDRLICATLDFYIGFVYDLIGLQIDHYLPVRVMSRMVGWLAHRNEELHATTRRPIHPSYFSLQSEPHIYIPLKERSA